MRIDKFLWCVRFYKTRNLANEEVKKNKVRIGGAIVKSGREVMVGDIITIRKNQIDYKVEVIQIPANRVGAKLVTLYIHDITPSEQLELLKARQLTQDYYRRKGEGRPTKKDRREIEGFLSPEEDEEEDEEEDTDWDSFFNDDEVSE